MGEWKRKSAGILIEGIDPRQVVFCSQKFVKQAYPLHSNGLAITGGEVQRSEHAVDKSVATTLLASLRRHCGGRGTERSDAATDSQSIYGPLLVGQPERDS